jgi:hypothetical protein
MKISTQISKQIILSQEELREAAINFALTQTELPGSSIKVEFEDDDNGDLTAIINVKAEDVGEQDEPKVAAKPRGRPRKEPAAVAAPVQQEIIQTTVAPPEAMTEAAADVPWIQNLPPVQEAPVADEKPVNATPVELPEKKNAIFPDIKSSAPVAQGAPVAVGNAKSLFANLTKPTHDAPRD